MLLLSLPTVSVEEGSEVWHGTQLQRQQDNAEVCILINFKTDQSITLFENISNVLNSENIIIKFKKMPKIQKALFLISKPFGFHQN